MPGIIRNLSKQTIIYAIGSALQNAVGFLLVPLYTRYLSVAQYGQLELLNTVLAISLTILSFGFASAILKCATRDSQNEEEMKIVSGTAFLFVLPWSVLIIILFFGNTSSLAQLFLNDSSHGNLIKVLLLTNLVSVFLALAFSVLRSWEKAGHYTFLNVLRFVLALGLNIYLVAFLKLNIFGILLANLIAQALITAVFLFMLPRFVKLSFNKRLFKKLWQFGWVIIPASLAMWVMDLSDRYFLKHYADFTEVGLYSLGYRIGFGVMTLLVMPFQLAWPTISYRLADQPNATKTFARVFFYFILAGCVLAAGLSIFGQAIIKILSTPSFYDAWKIIPLIAFAYVLYGLHFVLAQGIHIKEKTKYYPWLIVVPAILNILFNFYFVPRYGRWGAAFTTFISFLLVTAFTYFLANRFYPIKQEWTRIGKIILALIPSLILMNFAPDQLIINILTSLLIFGLFILLLFVFRVFNREEILFLRKIIKL